MKRCQFLRGKGLVSAEGWGKFASRRNFDLAFKGLNYSKVDAWIFDIYVDSYILGFSCI